MRFLEAQIGRLYLLEPVVSKHRNTGQILLVSKEWHKSLSSGVNVSGKAYKEHWGHSSKTSVMALSAGLTVNHGKQELSAEGRTLGNDALAKC